MKSWSTILKTLCLISILPSLLLSVAHAREKADFVYVDKSEAKLYLSKNGKIIKEYNVSFGGNPSGHKLEEGDNRTPEGLYTLDYKKKNSDFHRAIHISYPNRNDIRQARNRGVNPGGDIMIHGLRKDLEPYEYLMHEFNWTNGCIALSNQDVEEVWSFVDVPTPIRISP